VGGGWGNLGYNSGGIIPASSSTPSTFESSVRSGWARPVGGPPEIRGCLVSLILVAAAAVLLFSFLELGRMVLLL
jgi:hypothetical protein